MDLFTMQLFWEGEKDRAIAPFLPPLTLRFSDISEMRDIVKMVASHHKVPAHSFTIKTESTGAVERWFNLDGQWKRKDV